MLKELAQEIETCTQCPICANCKSRIVGEGPLGGVTVMSLSEASGADEDRVGSPYQGKAGKFWESMIGSVGWQRHNLYVTNVLKGRPPNNKYNPNLSEVDACIPYLERQISIVTPAIILAFGKLAGYALGIITKETFSARMTPKLGKQKNPYEYTDVHGNQCLATVYWLYHPSYLMRGKKEKECALMFEYLYEAKEEYDGLVARQAQG